VIREKFFEAKYRERLTGNSVLSKLFPELGKKVNRKCRSPHLQLTVGQSDRAGVPGNLITLTADVRLPPDVHVYAPGTQGYKPIKLVVDPLPEFEFRAASFPRSKILYLPAIKERVPVFEGAFRIRQELKVNSMADFSIRWGQMEKRSQLRATRISGLRQQDLFSAGHCACRVAVAGFAAGTGNAPRGIRHK